MKPLNGCDRAKLFYDLCLKNTSSFRFSLSVARLYVNLQSFSNALKPSLGFSVIPKPYSMFLKILTMLLIFLKASVIIPILI